MIKRRHWSGLLWRQVDVSSGEKKTQLPAKPSLQRKPAKKAVPLKVGTSKEMAKLQCGVCRKDFKYPFYIPLVANFMIFFIFGGNPSHNFSECTELMFADIIMTSS